VVPVWVLPAVPFDPGRFQKKASHRAIMSAITMRDQLTQANASTTFKLTLPPRRWHIREWQAMLDGVPSPVTDVNRDAPTSQNFMDIVNLVVPYDFALESRMKRMSHVHDRLHHDGRRVIGHSQRRKHKPRNDGPGGAEEEVVGSGADSGRESEGTSVELPSQVCREAELHHCEDDGEE
jgi:hypothetical protein